MSCPTRHLHPAARSPLRACARAMCLVVRPLLPLADALGAPGYHRLACSCKSKRSALLEQTDIVRVTADHAIVDNAHREQCNAQPAGVRVRAADSSRGEASSDGALPLSAGGARLGDRGVADHRPCAQRLRRTRSAGAGRDRVAVPAAGRDARRDGHRQPRRPRHDRDPDRAARRRSRHRRRAHARAR